MSLMEKLVLSSSARKHALPIPTILFESNHLLAISKPAGWIAHSSISNREDRNIHNNQRNDKCLLTALQSNGCGGGLNKSFLLPIHRIDQPCTGVQLYAKTHRAASRIQTQWSTHVQKSYLAVLEHTHSRTTDLLSRQNNKNSNGWSELCGYYQNRRRPYHSRQRVDKSGGWSVQMTPASTSDPPADVAAKSSSNLYRLCSLRYQVLNFEKRLLLVQTNQGARHMIRALLSQVGGIPVAGDLRYGATTPLPDQSVALHARHIELLDGMQLGNQHHDQHTRSFVAPIPRLWKDWFGITEHDILKYENAIRTDEAILKV